MRSRDEIFGDLEADRAVREREIRLIGNCARRSTSDEERRMFFRVSVLVTYAHLEGFCRFALSAYVGAINALRLPCSEASSALVAASLARVFAALRNPSSKHPLFSRLSPDDSKLHLLARERTFVEDFAALSKSPVEIPDNVVDPESNLSSLVLRKNLFRLGLPHPVIDERKGDLDMLLGVRNAIAHGDILKNPSEKEAERYTTTAFRVMQFVQNQVFAALNGEVYRRVR